MDQARKRPLFERVPLTPLIKELEPRPAHAVLAPPDYEDRVMDLAIEALEDIQECDQARLCVKWDQVQDRLVPLLYIFFRSDLKGTKGELPRVHVDDKGRMCPAHAVALVTVSKSTGKIGHLLQDPGKIKDLVRGGVEKFLHQHNVVVTHFNEPAAQPKLLASS
jgi:hypothetical protein